MTKFKVHFDGKVLIPDEPVDLPVNCALEVQIKRLESGPTTDKPLMRLLKTLSDLPPNPDWPADGAAQHDHYLYGVPKRP